MGKVNAILAIILIAGLAVLPSGCAVTSATTGTATASATVTTTGSVDASATVPAPTLPLSTTTLPPPSTGTAGTTEESAKFDLTGAYLAVIDHLIDNRQITAPPFKYLAIDMTQLPDFTPADKERLFQGLEKHGLQLLDKTFAELKAEGYIKNSSDFTDGAWVDLKDIRMDGPVMTLDASIHLNGLNAYGMDDFSVTYLGTHWEITRTDVTWVA